LTVFHGRKNLNSQRNSSLGGAGGSEAGDRVINQILTEIDGVGARKNVFVIGATNRPDVLDPAVIRPGRLDQLIYIPLPDLKSRIAIFASALRKAPVDPNIDIEVLARSTHGFSGADIAEICTSASKLAIREAILAAEEITRQIEAGESDEDAKEQGVGEHMLITKRHFNFAMSRARRSVSEKDLVLFEEFAEKQRAGRGEAANFKFGDSESVAEGEGNDDTQDDLYS
jgi:transitional endoplasmic reticulum ATPase